MHFTSAKTPNSTWVLIFKDPKSNRSAKNHCICSLDMDELETGLKKSEKQGLEIQNILLPFVMDW